MKIPELNWPLMANNITPADLRGVADFVAGEPILTQSRKVLEFEAAWSQWLGVKHSVFVNSGSSANLVTLAVLKEIHGGGEVILPTLTWVSDITAAIHNDFDPVFVDIDPRTLGMDVEQILAKITPKTRAVFITHILGYNALNQRLITELKKRKIPLIEDVCESHGATFKGRKLGVFGWISNFSFYYAHHLSTIEGGMICTDDPAVYEIARMMRGHGMVRESLSPETRARYIAAHPDLNPDFIFAFPAYNVRSTELNAVIGLAQLPRLDANNKLRSRNLALFLKHLDGKKYFTDFAAEGSSNYAFTLILRKSDPKLWAKVEKLLRAAKVEFRRGTSGGGNQLRQPYMRKLYPAIRPEDYPKVDHVHFYGCYLGNYPTLDPTRIETLCKLLNQL